MIILFLGFLTACSLAPAQATQSSQAVSDAATVEAIPPTSLKESTATATPGLADATATLTVAVEPSPVAETSAETAVAAKPTVSPTAEIRLTKTDFLKLTSEQRQEWWDKAPETIDGLSKSNFSTLIPYLIIYRDENGEGLRVYNLLTREQTGLLEAGIAEFTLTGNNFQPEVKGTKGEMRAFTPLMIEGATTEVTETAQIKALEEMFKYIVEETGVKWGDVAEFIRGSVSLEYLDEYRKLHPLVGNIPNEGNWQRRYLPLDPSMPKRDKFLLWIDSVEYQGKTYVVLNYRSPASEYNLEDTMVMAVMSEGQFMRLLDGRKVTIPPQP